MLHKRAPSGHPPAGGETSMCPCLARPKTNRNRRIIGPTCSASAVSHASNFSGQEMRGPIPGLSVPSGPSFGFSPLQQRRRLSCSSPSSPPLFLFLFPSPSPFPHVRSRHATPCLVWFGGALQFQNMANHDRRPRTAPSKWNPVFSRLDGWGNGSFTLLCRADTRLLARTRGGLSNVPFLVMELIHVTFYRSHRLPVQAARGVSVSVCRCRCHCHCQPPLQTGLCVRAPPSSPDFSISARRGLFLPVGRLTRNKCPQASGYAVSCAVALRCVACSVALRTTL